MRRRIRCERHVAGRRTRYTYKILVGKPKEIHHLEDQSVGGSIILKWTFKI
jgi:hypothetical protein